MGSSVKKMTQFMMKQKIRTDCDGKISLSKGGNIIHEIHSSTDRYIIDFADDFKSEGWMQFDTDQDAHYFGYWVNPSQRKTLCYAEGDWTFIWCADAAGYNREIVYSLEYYHEVPAFITIDNGRQTNYYQDRAVFFAE